MGHIRSFVPWIAVAVLTGTVDIRWAALTGLLLALALVAIQRRSGRGWDAQVIEASAVLFLAAYTAAAFAAPDSTAVTHYGPPLSSLWLAATAWGSLVLGHPFTLGIARTQTPEHLWNSPLFLQINRVITTVWAAAFTLSGLGGALLRHYRPDAGDARTLLTVATFAVPLLFTIRYPTLARARHAAAPKVAAR
ncbi:hypothetical protein OG689_37200 [Kitasatospora sp. NBC_00240]|uniref:hypothetical protein n=1 Tax=Kitasatospora sp. NBC_00240 TaxID=2903567 RepID=UPI00224E8BD8|nr:hypothetical protein [Kitasatospora sp. NBC_00240]MCX5214833.1 hypothetical protein [Kitasatospora sp. NBC_00240]